MTKPLPSTNTIDEVELERRWFDEYQDSIRKMVAEMQADGVSLKTINEKVLPQCNEYYKSARDKAMKEYLQLLELHEPPGDDDTQH
jgi:predicted secreted protein